MVLMTIQILPFDKLHGARFLPTRAGFCSLRLEQTILSHCWILMTVEGSFWDVETDAKGSWVLHMRTVLNNEHMFIGWGLTAN